MCPDIKGFGLIQSPIHLFGGGAVSGIGYFSKFLWLKFGYFPYPWLGWILGNFIGFRGTINA
jgi:hypothetical protein